MGRKVALRVSREACLVMLASAIETFPKECVGQLFSDGSSFFAMPFQIAHRTKVSVVSYSSRKISVICGRRTKKFAEYHSHPFEGWELVSPPEPSFDDVKGMCVGDIEFIINIYKLDNSRKFVTSSNGEIRAGMGFFRLSIRAFEKIAPIKGMKAFDSKPSDYYNRVNVYLE